MDIGLCCCGNRTALVARVQKTTATPSSSRAITGEKFLSIVTYDVKTTGNRVQLAQNRSDSATVSSNTTAVPILAAKTVMTLPRVAFLQRGDDRGLSRRTGAGLSFQ